MAVLGGRRFGIRNPDSYYKCKIILRLLSQSSNGERMRTRIVNEDSLAEAKDTVLRVLGNGSRGISNCVLLRLRQSKILFNCGIGDSGFRSNGCDVFITHLDWSKIGGLLPLIYKTSGANKAQLTVCGPPGLDVFIKEAATKFLRVKDFTVNLADHDTSLNSQFRNISITSIPIRNKNPTHFKPPPVDKSWVSRSFVHKVPGCLKFNGTASGKIDSNVSYSYICRAETSRLWNLSECVKRGIQPGSNMQKLWNGESVVVEDGSVVKPEDVIEYEVWPNVIVVDCPTYGYIDNLLAKGEYEEFYKGEKLMVVHFTPAHVMHDQRYISWMKRFSQETQHLIINGSNEWVPYFKMFNRQEVCRMIAPKFFPKLPVPNDFLDLTGAPDWVEFGDMYLESVSLEPVRDSAPSQSWLKKWKRMPKDLKLVQSWPGTTIHLADRSVTKSSDPLITSEPPQFNEPSAYYPQNPRITFLGTGSQSMSSHRSTSAILVQMSPDKSMLLDCGDGTILQLASLLGEADLQKLLTSIRCIYISHTHGDHHIGLIGVLQAIRKAWKSTRHEPKQVLLLLPAPLLAWFEFYNEKLEPIFHNTVMFSLSELITSNEPNRKKFHNFLEKVLDINNIKLCWAKHSAFSCCVTIEHKCGWKISYSGDSQYNPRFIEIGKNSDLLIHEATYAAGLSKMANAAKHSTTADAIRVGREMNAKQIILTHFSQRYPVVPRLVDLDDTLNVSVAFDHLQVNLNDVGHLPKLNETYKTVFGDYVADVEDLHERLMKKQLVMTDDEVSSEQ